MAVEPATELAAEGYDMYYNPPRAGDFFLVPIKGKVGLGIRFGQWLNGGGFIAVQHAGIYIGGDYTVEAMPGGAIKGRLSDYIGGPIIWSSDMIELRQSERISIVAHALDYVGTPYSFLDYLGLFLQRFRLRPSWLKRYTASTKHMICSQLVDQCYDDAGVHLFSDGRIAGDVTPADLYHLVKDLQWMDSTNAP